MIVFEDIVLMLCGIYVLSDFFGSFEEVIGCRMKVMFGVE